jgi:hypothetical protein
MLNVTKVDVRENHSREFNRKTRVYVWPEGETLMENLQNRRGRPHTVYRKEVLPGVLRQMGLSENTKVRWSQYAGCSCPCSPGFVVDDSYGKTVHVTVTG